MWSRPATPALLLLVATAAVALAGPTAPTTRPSAAPTTAPTTAPVAVDPFIQRLFDRLVDPDPVVRDDALVGLMGLPTDALPRLLEVVQHADPLQPAQAAVLHEIVCQVFLAGDPYVPVTDKIDPGRTELRHVIGLRGTDMTDEEGPVVPLGVPVVDRWPGFPARRLLRDGDLILGIWVDRHGSVVPTHHFLALRTAILTHPDVSDVDLSILRDGRQVRVSMTLAPQAFEALRPSIRAAESFLNNRRSRAQTYWQRTFAALVDPVAEVDTDADRPTVPQD